MHIGSPNFVGDCVHGGLSWGTAKETINQAHKLDNLSQEEISNI